MSKQTRTDLFQRISQTKGPMDPKKLKKLLIIRGQEPDHFFSCICEKFNGFVKNPELFKWMEFNRVHDEYKPYQPDDSFAFLSCVDIVNQESLQNEHIELFRYHFDYDFVVFPLYAGCSISERVEPIFHEIMNIMKELISSKRIAVLFLRGSNEYSVPSRLGYVCTSTQQGFVDYTYQMIDIDVEALNEVCMNSIMLLEFKTKHSYLFMENEKHKIVDLSQTYLCGMKVKSCIDVSQWHILAKSEDGQKLSMLIHKTERVMFTPWYGFCHGNQLSDDLVRYFCKYLVLEYLNKDDLNFKAKLYGKYQHCQLCDVVVIACCNQ
ncbi:hypothetical protein C9374_005682 [Naegleria lovaniensis]|uniref:Uncharacterized protein n=1 Tax=Naegleria lovaniensis TaxID=51637 RepID=A0AA88KJT6_NAELO|nr:uncharacterized protein C9374_005682 [Naegleria lovaniensis]KAG2381890.1 hypothetical protein C9374_005682 [Naegleria lovaniensis]